MTSVCDLEGAELDYWVRKALNHPCLPSDFSPSDDWSEGGPIIEREKIQLNVHLDSAEWVATKVIDDNHITHTTGLTPLIAAMRCFVTSKYGETVPETEAA